MTTIGELWLPQHDTSGEQFPGCHVRYIEHNVRLWFLLCVISKTEGAIHDVCAGEDVTFSHEETCADHVAIRCVDPYQ
jgi:hypothetical protein